VTSLEVAAAVATIVGAALSFGALLAALWTIGRAAEASFSAEATVRLTILERLGVVAGLLRRLEAAEASGDAIARESIALRLDDALMALGTVTLPETHGIVGFLLDEDSNPSPLFRVEGLSDALIEVAVAQDEQQGVLRKRPGWRSRR
jgi:hypothetical protein